MTLTPVATGVIAGAPTFSPLGVSSDTCYATGCGYTGWIEMEYTFTTAGTYLLGFGVTNLLDSAFQTAFAIAGVAINDVSINETPEPLRWLCWDLVWLVSALLRRRGWEKAWVTTGFLRKPASFQKTPQHFVVGFFQLNDISITPDNDNHCSSQSASISLIDFNSRPISPISPQRRVRRQRKASRSARFVSSSVMPVSVARSCFQVFICGVIFLLSDDGAAGSTAAFSSFNATFDSSRTRLASSSRKR